MKSIIITLIAFSTFTFFNDDPLSLLQKAQSKINGSGYFRYDYTILWPNPVGEVDTVSGTGTFSRQSNQYYGYNYIKIGKDGSDLVYIDNEFKLTQHEERTVVLYTEEDIQKNKNFITDNSFAKNTPVVFLNRKNWRFMKDTTLLGNEYSAYRILDKDTVVENNKIYVELYAFINKTTAQLDRYERRAFLNNKKSQTIIYSFSGYEFSKDKKQLNYTLPENYRTQVGMKKEKLTLLKEGQPAPLFLLSDLKGNPVNLQAMRGKKTLLVFSTINCGYCKLALDHFNKKGYQLPASLTGAYLFPEDKIEKMSGYAQKIKIPFSTVANAKNTGKDYGVSGYPTFFLINEQGIIEKVVVGYEEKFMESLQK